MRERIVGVVLATMFAAGAAAGCAKKEPIREAEAMADAICKCKDFECALEARKAGTARLARWKDARGTEDEAKQVGAALARSEGCEQKLKATSAPVPAAAAGNEGGNGAPAAATAAEGAPAVGSPPTPTPAAAPAQAAPAAGGETR